MTNVDKHYIFKEPTEEELKAKEETEAVEKAKKEEQAKLEAQKMSQVQKKVYIEGVGDYIYQLPDTATEIERAHFTKKVFEAHEKNEPLVLDPRVKILNKKPDEEPIETVHVQASEEQKVETEVTEPKTEGTETATVENATEKTD